MHFKTIALSAALFVPLAVSGRAAHTQARLVVAGETARAGDTVMGGVHLRMDPGWHTYWRNAGVAGIPTSVAWQLPPGVTVGDLQWPVPEKLDEQGLTTYIYTNEVVLLFSIKLAPDLPPGPLDLRGKVAWLECKLECVKAEAEVKAGLAVGTGAKPSADARLLEAWQKRLPRKGDGLSAIARWEGSARGDSRPLVLGWNSSQPAGAADFFPDAGEQFEVQAEMDRLPSAPGKIALRMRVKKFSGEWPAEISGLCLQQTGAERLAYDVRLPISGSGGTPAAAGPALTPPPLWKMLLYAFIGGLILNVMPCVLPVLALKILGFVNQAKDHPRRVRQLGMIYALGVLVSFLALAGLVIGVQAAGHRAAWGMQFANPEFLVVLTVLVTLVALNLFGLFEINPGGRVLDAAGVLASRHGPAGAFFNGMLATVLATPCTAPFLGAALGFASLANSAGIVVLIFLTAGLGLAAPYVVLSWQPAWLKFLPKPGLWMERFKVAMGFPMLATAVWLFGLIPLHYGGRTLWLGLFLVLIALAAWMYGQFVQRGTSHRGLALAAVLVLVLGGYFYVIEGQLDWRAPVTEAGARSPLRKSAGGIEWQPWSPEAVAEARAAGRPVFVDFTADWCLTCQANKRIAIEIPSVRARIKQLNAVALLGDATRWPPEITEELNRFGRAGVPLVLVYPKEPGAPPIVLPEALTPGIVLGALDRAGR